MSLAAICRRADGSRVAGQGIGRQGQCRDDHGVPGLSTTVAEQAGAADAFKAAPDIKLVGTVYGFWSPPASKTEMVKFLATHPQKIDGIWAAAICPSRRAMP